MDYDLSLKFRFRKLLGNDRSKANKSKLDLLTDTFASLAEVRNCRCYSVQAPWSGIQGYQFSHITFPLPQLLQID